MVSNKISIAILAGGKNSRFGYEEKGLVNLNEKSIVSYLLDEAKNLSDDCFIINNNGAYEHLNEKVYNDIYVDKGPLSGIYTALNFCRYDSVLVIACDMPFINKELFKYLVDLHDSDVTLPVFKDRDQPLCCIYSKSLHKRCKESLELNKLKIVKVIEEANYKRLPINENLDFYHDHLFFNMNTKDDLKIIKELSYDC